MDIPLYLQRSSHIFTAIIDIEGEILYANKAMTEGLKLCVYGKNNKYLWATGLISEKEEMHFHQITSHVLDKTQGEPYEFCLEMQIPDMPALLVRWEASTIEIKGKQLMLFIGYPLNGYEKQVEELKKELHNLSAVNNSTIEAISYIDLNLKVVYNNRVADILLKNLFKNEVRVGDDFLSSMPEEMHDGFLRYYQQLTHGNSIQAERTFDGKRWWLFSISPVYG